MKKYWQYLGDQLLDKIKKWVICLGKREQLKASVSKLSKSFRRNKENPKKIVYKFTFTKVLDKSDLGLDVLDFVNIHL